VSYVCNAWCVKARKLICIGSVDRKTDELMPRIIREEFANHTIIAIAHRLDRIMVLNKRELKECDSPSNLLARPSAFREFKR